MNNPEHIYRYMSLSQLNLLNLKQNHIYFSSTNKFNDPYDSDPEAKIQTLTKTETLKLKNIFKDDLVNKNLNCEEIESLTLNELKNLIGEQFNKIIKEQKIKWGVACFSETHDNLLMWSHYADSHKGVCLKFNTNYEPFDKLRKVHYENVIPKLNPYDVLTYDVDKMMKIFCTKHSCWRYEKEWRAFHKETDKVFRYPNEAIEAIYFGSKVETAMKDIVCTLFVNQHPNIKFFESELDDCSYKINFNEFNYMTYLEAVNKGLK